jgi:CDP-6-deoxy-D-xylo-4-hexulose-3-dehydrase
MQAAIGVSQLKKLPGFIQKRNENFEYLHSHLSTLEEFLILPQATPNSQPSWFGFPIAVRASAPFTRNELIAYLDKLKIDTRLLFGGNLLRQPAYANVTHRAAAPLNNADFITTNVFWLGVYPGLSRVMLDFEVEALYNYVKKFKP